MAINGHKYEDPQNERWAVHGVEAKLAELERLIKKLASDVARLDKRGK